MVFRKLTNDTCEDTYRDCLDVLLDKNISEGVFYKRNDKCDYLIFDKKYLSYANKKIFLNIASIYGTYFMFSDDIDDDKEESISMRSYYERCIIIIKNKIECSNKKYWYIRLPRNGSWRNNYRAKAAFLYIASHFLRQDPFMLDGNRDILYVSSLMADEYDSYCEEPEDMQPYRIETLLDNTSKDFCKPYTVSKSEDLVLNEDETQDSIEEYGSEFIGCNFKVMKKSFVFHHSPVTGYARDYLKSKKTFNGKE